MPLLPEFTTELSSMFQFFLMMIAVATAGYALKVKFIGAAQKYAKEVEARIFDPKEPGSIISRAISNHERINKLEERVNSNEREIGRLDERSKHQH
jgi:hypothetical protein